MFSFLRKTAKVLIVQPYRDLRDTEFVWTNIINHRARRLYRASPPVLDGLQQRLVTQMRETGYAMTTVQELMPEISLKELQELAEKEVSERERSSPVYELAVNPRILDVANAYRELFWRVYETRLAKTPMVAEGTERTWSQNWHRDWYDVHTVQVFIYLSDVNEELDGAFCYTPNSIRGKKWGKLAHQTHPKPISIPPETYSNAIPANEMKPLTGPAGTMVFADTSGIHRGGYSTKHSRFALTLAYVSDAYYPKKRRHPLLASPGARYALL